MPIVKMLDSEINGFKVIKDLGREKNDVRYAIVICPGCHKEFKTSTYHIRKIKSCGCLPIKQAKLLEKEINGFVILKDFGYCNGSRRALAICKVCKNEYEVDPNKLKYRNHCGCIKNGTRVCIYAASHPRLMQIYQHMMARCYNKNNKDYYNYGDRGIRVCDEWLEKPYIFCKWGIGSGYRDTLTIDRIDSNKNYEPNNCRWADAKMQARNTRRNVLTMELAKQMRIDRKTMTYQQLADKYNVSHGTVYWVISNRIWKE